MCFQKIVEVYGMTFIFACLGSITLVQYLNYLCSIMSFCGILMFDVFFFLGELLMNYISYYAFLMQLQHHLIYVFRKNEVM